MSSTMQTCTPCPSCGAPIYWYHLLHPAGPRCPGCRSKVRLDRPSQVVAAITLAAWAALAVLLVAGLLRALKTTWQLPVVAVAAGLAGGLAYCLFMVQGRKLRVKVKGDPSNPAYYATMTLCCLGLALVVGAATVGTMMMSWPGFGPTFPAPNELTVLGKADPGWKLRTLDGKEVSFSKFEGKVVFLNIWATWCKPCVGELPSIQALHDSLKDTDVVFALVSSEDVATVRTFVEANKYHLPIFTRGSPTPDIFHTRGIPATFVINRKGEVVFQHIGGNDWNTDACRAFLKSLL